MGLGLYATHQSREWNRFPDVVDATKPCQRPFEAESKPAVRNGPVASQIQIPFEHLLRQSMLADLALQEFEVSGTLPSSDDLAISLRRKNVHTEGQPVVFRIPLHVEGLDLGGIAMHDDGSIEMPGKHRLVASSEIIPPLECTRRLGPCGEIA